MNNLKQVAIVGCGMAGIAAASVLQNKVQLHLFDKGRQIGGRMATRRRLPFTFDHGAQFFTAKSEAFNAWLAPFIHQGLVQPWQARFVEFTKTNISSERYWDASHPHYVAVPSMPSLAKHIAENLPNQATVKRNTKVIQANFTSNQTWQLITDQGPILQEFDILICTLPAPQAADILPQAFVTQFSLRERPITPCFSLLAGFNQPLELGWDVAIVKQSPISWISHNHTKPGRGTATSFTIMSTNAWAQSHFEADEAQVQQQMIEAANPYLQYKLEDAHYLELVRWRYANVKKQLGPDICMAPQTKLIACGDWCIQGRIESAFESGTQAGLEALSWVARTTPNAHSA